MRETGSNRHAGRQVITRGRECRVGDPAITPSDIIPRVSPLDHPTRSTHERADVGKMQRFIVDARRSSNRMDE